MMRVALQLLLPAMLQPTISLLVHPNVIHVLAVGTDAAAPTEVCGKVPRTELRHKNLHLISSTHV